MRVALYKNLEYGWLSVIEVENNDTADNSSKYLRMSEIVEVDFEMLPEVDLVAAQVSALRQAKTSLQAETEIKLQGIDKQISELLALTYEGE